MRNLVVLILVLLSSTSLFANDNIYQIDTLTDDDTLLINGINFATQAYCPDIEVGDEVEFISGDPKGNCSEAEILNLRTNQVCHTWCQSPIE